MHGGYAKSQLCEDNARIVSSETGCGSELLAHFGATFLLARDDTHNVPTNLLADVAPKASQLSHVSHELYNTEPEAS